MNERNSNGVIKGFTKIRCFDVPMFQHREGRLTIVMFSDLVPNF